MIRKLFTALVCVLALNLLGLMGAVGWLFQSKKLDGEKVKAIKEIVFATPQPPEVVATQPSTQPATRPSTLKLEALLAKYAGKRIGEQVELIQQSIDAQVAALDRRGEELESLMAQILREKQELARSSKALDEERQQLAAEKKSLADQAADAGFADSLKLYSSMSPKQAKSTFMTMPEELVARYLLAMQPRAVAGILREFKAPPEEAFMARVMERVRGAGENPGAAEPPTAPAGPASGEANARANAGSDALRP